MKRRELASWIGLATLAVAMLAVCGVVGWSLLPRERRLSLGPQTSFPTDQPKFLALDPSIYIFVVNLDGELVAWNAVAPTEGGYHYKWVPTNHRFEDPASGDKWCLDGTVVDQRFTPARTLDQYRLEVDQAGNVWLYPNQKILGTPAADAEPAACPNP